MFHAESDPISKERETFRSYLEKESHLKYIPFYKLFSFNRQQMLPETVRTVEMENLTQKACLFLGAVCCMIRTIGWRTAVDC